jgi:hypothetical protein
MKTTGAGENNEGEHGVRWDDYHFGTINRTKIEI